MKLSQYSEEVFEIIVKLQMNYLEILYSLGCYQNLKIFFFVTTVIRILSAIIYFSQMSIDGIMEKMITLLINFLKKYIWS